MTRLLLDRKIIELIDLYFAENLEQFAGELSQEQKVFIAILMAMSRNGHVCMKVKPKVDLSALELDDSMKWDLEARLAEVVNYLPPSIMSEADAIAGDAKPMILDREFIYFHRNWMYEREIEFHVNRLNKNKVNRCSHEYEIHIDRIAGLNELQRQAVKASFEESILIIAGGPGCGKTYVAKKIIECFQQLSKVPIKIEVCAPTGKAVQNIEKSIQGDGDLDIHFGTLHSLLKFNPQCYKQKDSAFIDANIILVDECSMIDVKLFSQLLASIHPSSQLILLGDPNQLPPVESGTIFNDLCLYSPIKKVILTECLRTKSQDLLRLAHLFFEPRASQLLKKIQGENNQTFSFHSLHDVHGELLKSYAENLFFPNPANARFSEIESAFMEKKILCSHNRGLYGSTHINRMIMQYLLKEVLDDTSLAIPIILTKNYPKLRLMNGTQGIWVKDGDQELFYFSEISGFRSIPKMLLPAHDLAFAISIHKSQGSEYQDIIMLLDDEMEGIGRESIYTGITRSRRSIQIYASQRTLEGAIQRSSLRQSGLRFSH
ncbi:MAG: exodeoxyribonuclease V subunit alpha [Simkaniaceae bacterium]|nr:exodeoxyribonuclease V subunit alpha [Simkaniaceae bacterium]